MRDLPCFFFELKLGWHDNRFHIRGEKVLSIFYLLFHSIPDGDHAIYSPCTNLSSMLFFVCR